MGERGPEKQFSDKITVRLTWQQKRHLERIADDHDLDDLSKAVRQVIDEAIQERDRNPEADPDQLEIEP